MDILKALHKRFTTTRRLSGTNVVYSYIHDDTRMETVRTVPNNEKLLLRIYYRNRYIPYTFYNRNVFYFKRDSIELDLEYVTTILEKGDDEVGRYLTSLFELKPSQVIVSVKMRHSHHGIDNSRMKFSFTNTDAIREPILITDYMPCIQDRLPASLKHVIVSKKVLADHTGICTRYVLSDPLKLYAYLKLVNFFNDDELRYYSCMVLPLNHTRKYLSMIE